MYRFSYLLIGITLLGTIVVPAGKLEAETVYRSGGSITIDANQVVKGDLYAIGEAVVVSGTVEGDVHALAGNITLNGPVSGDVSLLGNTINVHGAVSDDVRVAGLNVTLAKPIAGDVFVYAGKLTILSTATIGGDIFFFGGEGGINAPVAGSVLGKASRLRINSVVSGSVDVTVAGGLALGEHAIVAGDVRHTSGLSLTRSPNAVIEGEVVENSVPREALDIELIILIALVLLFTSLTLLLFTKKRLQQLSELVITKVFLNGLIGIGVVLTIPIIIAVLYYTQLGILIAAVLLSGGLFFLLIAAALSGIMVGALLSRLITGKAKISITWAVLGSVILAAILFVPYLGLPVALLMVLITLGSLVQVTYCYLSNR